MNINLVLYNNFVGTTKLYSFHPTNSTAKSLILLGHGVDLNPEKMNDLLLELNSLGHDVVRIALAGHRENEDPALCSSQLWIDEFITTYKYSKEIAEKKSYPLNFLGYSLSALIALNLQIQNTISFDKQVFLAPALELKQITKVMKVLITFNYPSKLLPMAGQGFHINSFKALFELQEIFQTNKESIPDTKTLIITRKNDEVVSYEDTIRLINNFSLNSWTIKELDDSKKVKVQHFCFDKNCMDSYQWKGLIKDFELFF